MIERENTIIENTVPSPCINRCQLDDSSICTGCYRSIDEIVEWSRLTNIEKERILSHVNKRRLNEKVN